jgi:hypothetical protein
MMQAITLLFNWRVQRYFIIIVSSASENNDLVLVALLKSLFCLQDSLVSVLRMVFVPSPIEVTHPRNHDDSVLSGLTYGTAMVSGPFSASCS